MDLSEKKQIDSNITYYEKKIGKTLFRVTNVYKGEIDLATALENLIVQKVLRHEDTTFSGRVQP